jgi:glutaredoxin 3
MDIKIYVRTTEPWSDTLEHYLEQNCIPYQKVDVNDDANAFQEMVRKSGQRKVPVIEIEGKIVTGYDPEMILKIIDECQGAK